MISTALKTRFARSETGADELRRLGDALAQADAVVVGAGAGLSTSAGFIYSGERFQKYFDDFEARYHFQDMYSGGFYPYKTLEEHWAYWSRYIYVNRYMDAPKPVYERLFELVRDRDYFVLTTNVDHCFQKAGFDKHRLFYTQGDYGLFQCSVPCHSDTYDNEEMVRNMLEAQGVVIGAGAAGEKDGMLASAEGAVRKTSIPTDLVPRCPRCGKPMSMNLRADDTFVQDKGWETAAGRYSDFLRRHRRQNVLFLELGVGYNTPGIIKYPFWQMTADNPKATYACINFDYAECPDEIRRQSICIKGDAGEVLGKLDGRGEL
jgi:NAD-dependent SIR2 family protein deacetylase